MYSPPRIFLVRCGQTPFTSVEDLCSAHILFRDVQKLIFVFVCYSSFSCSLSFSLLTPLSWFHFHVHTLLRLLRWHTCPHNHQSWYRGCPDSSNPCNFLSLATMFHGDVDMTSFGDAVMDLTGYQDADTAAPCEQHLGTHRGN